MEIQGPPPFHDVIIKCQCGWAPLRDQGAEAALYDLISHIGFLEQSHARHLRVVGE